MSFFSLAIVIVIIICSAAWLDIINLGRRHELSVQSISAGVRMCFALDAADECVDSISVGPRVQFQAGIRLSRQRRGDTGTARSSPCVFDFVDWNFVNSILKKLYGLDGMLL